MSKYTEGNLVTKGKTKSLFGVNENPNLLIVSSNNNITANDDPSLTKQFETKAVSANNTTCNVFELLNKAGIHTAYIERHSDTAFVARKCKMIPLEVIIRRYADGSALKRMPHLKTPEGQTPHRFSHLLFELFLKTTDGGQLEIDGRDLVPGNTQEDPFISDPHGDIWDLYLPKTCPIDQPEAALNLSVNPKDVIGNVDVDRIEKLARQVFLVLESAWSIKYGYRLVDFKIEFGIDPDGNLVVSDVIDNDSWRLRTSDWCDISKQLFRDGHSLAEVEDKYQRVSTLSNNLTDIPNQAIILWRGSIDDNIPEVLTSEKFSISGICVEDIVISAHKKPQKALNKLNELQAQYPQGAVIIAIAGMSNGLGPTLSAQTIWPVINCPPGIDDHPEDIWSSLRLPSNVPASTIINPKNAVMHALNILSITNPLAAMLRQYEMEYVVNS